MASKNKRWRRKGPARRAWLRVKSSGRDPGWSGQHRRKNCAVKRHFWACSFRLKTEEGPK